MCVACGLPSETLCCDRPECLARVTPGGVGRGPVVRSAHFTFDSRGRVTGRATK